MRMSCNAPFPPPNAPANTRGPPQGEKSKPRSKWWCAPSNQRTTFDSSRVTNTALPGLVFHGTNVGVDFSFRREIIDAETTLGNGGTPRYDI